MTKVDLPGGEWADLVPMDEVREKDRRPVMRAFRAVLRHRDAAAIDGDGPVPEDLVTAGDELNDLLAVARVREWSYPEPVTLEAVANLPRPAYTALTHAVAQGFAELVRDFPADPDPGSPTGP